MPRAAQQFKGNQPAKKAERRGSTARGYDRRWRKYRRWFLRGNPLCVRCGAAATDVDHIVEIAGQGDPLFWNESNHQALCHRCHSKKTMGGR